MTGSLKLPPIEFLMRMSPLAAAQSLLFATLNGELTTFIRMFSTSAATTISKEGPMAFYPALWALLGNGMLAFFLNVSSFQTNKVAGALTISVCGNLKQCLTVAVGIMVFGDFTIDVWNSVGICTALMGAGLYSKSELDAKKVKVYQHLPLSETAQRGERE